MMGPRASHIGASVHIDCAMVLWRATARSWKVAEVRPRRDLVKRSVYALGPRVIQSRYHVSLVALLHLLYVRILASELENLYALFPFFTKFTVAHCRRDGRYSFKKL